MDCSYFGVHGNDFSPQKWIYSVWNRPVLHLSFWKSNRAFQRPIPLFSLQACLDVSSTAVAISVHTAAKFWQDCWLADPCCPAATERFMTLVRPFTFNVFICDFVCVCVCVCICTLTPLGSILAVAIAIPCILLVAVLNCPSASGLQGLTGPMCFVLLVVPNSALLYHTTMLYSLHPQYTTTTNYPVYNPHLHAC